MSNSNRSKTLSFSSVNRIETRLLVLQNYRIFKIAGRKKLHQIYV
ncbi:hypothetical protein LEP1GSC008_3155 [Leptospira kirschneri serovar Bulgarica str. Nikolaevo]|uniref:Uncharacterized protein n=1 Tax=Leptospira kirschneri serovar Bulgarica str. Nikolaevo TaxID=1240687 RepID=M6FFZ6_9LEPT|nr:hypothetical protein LEP1GSC008_3155 [Leptospira kirschneri serovar Bulgarica str. Nikolaevo]